jgi:hypothetical protein
LPPFSYCKILSKLFLAITKGQPTASLWIKVDAPGLWFALEIQRGLRDLKIPVAVTQPAAALTLSDFNLLPWTSRSQTSSTAGEAAWKNPVSVQEVNCLRVLARLRSASTQEIASLAGMSERSTFRMLARVITKKYVAHLFPKRINGNPLQNYEYISPYWSITRLGLSIALRSWHVPPGTSSSWRMEASHGEGKRHRRTARQWVGSLKKDIGALGEIWAGWTEVYLTDLHVIPDALAWGCIEGIETLFWLEVESGHISGEEVIRNTIHRFQAASAYAADREVQLVFAVLGRPWVGKVVRVAFTNIMPHVAVLIGDWKDFGHLAEIQWGKISQAGPAVAHRRKVPFSPEVQARLG